MKSAFILSILALVPAVLCKNIGFAHLPPNEKVPNGYANLRWSGLDVARVNDSDPTQQLPPAHGQQYAVTTKQGGLVTISARLAKFITLEEFRYGCTSGGASQTENPVPCCVNTLGLLCLNGTIPQIVFDNVCSIGGPGMPGYGGLKALTTGCASYTIQATSKVNLFLDQLRVRHHQKVLRL